MSTTTEGPSFWQHRLTIWDELYAEQEKELASKAKESIKITLPDGSEKEGVSFETTPFDIAKSISNSLAKQTIIAKVDDTLWDLHRPFEASCRLELLKFDSEEGKNVFWHSSAHILGQALEKKFGGKLCIGPPIDDGFYYDMAVEENINPESYDELQKFITSIVRENQPFQRLSIPKEKALEMFKYNKYKTEIIQKKVPDGECCTAYRCGPLIDLCKGPHVPGTGKIQAFKVLKSSAAYWLGNAENDSLQRVYGISFPDRKSLRKWEIFQQEAAKRDHRKIGKDQELFFFHRLSPGCCFMLPHGHRIISTLRTFIQGEYKKRGFTEVETPNIFNQDLWRTSGHLQHYADDMFTFESGEKVPMAMKPMNCPGHCVMFDHRSRSYKELPLRLAEYGVLHRNEASGTLTGLTRVRRFIQDDGHIFCRPDQVKQEMKGCLDFMSYVYGVFGFQFELGLSTRPEKKYVGDIEVWNKAEKALAEALDEFGQPWKFNPGDGAFYGPKIDILVKDALNRAHQCATIQLDFNLPERFDLNFQAADGTLQRPVMIHRAVLGSFERFLAVLIEHIAGKWPFWLSPRQAVVIPVSDKYLAYAEKVGKELHEAGFYVDVDATDNTMQKKIRNGQLSQYNFMLVVGEKEQEANTANMRDRDGKVHGEKSIPNLIEEFKQLAQDRK